jgi:tetratricopeptide (TPR) repeat protein
MKIRINKRKFWLKLALLVLLVPVVWLVATPIIKPWAIRTTDRRIAQWEQLQDDGYAMMKARKYDDAEALFRAALRYAETKLIAQPSREASSIFALGGVLWLQKRFDEARSYFERNLLITEQENGESSPELCTVLGRLVEVCIKTGDFAAALEYAQRAVSILEGQDLSPNPDLPSALRDLARVYEKQKDYVAALPIRERIVRLMEADQQLSARELAIAYYREALMHNVLEDYGAAEKLYQRSLTVLKKLAALRGNLEPEVEYLELLVRNYASLLEATGRPDEASRLRTSRELPAGP